jgi:hypothetical protein
MIDLEPLKLECNFTPPDFIRVDEKPNSRSRENGQKRILQLITRKKIFKN